MFSLDFRRVTHLGVSQRVLSGIGRISVNCFFLKAKYSMSNTVAPVSASPGLSRHADFFGYDGSVVIGSKYGDERFLRNIDATELLHFSFAFFLLVKQLVLAGHVTTV